MKVKSLALAVGALGVVTLALWLLNRDDNGGTAAADPRLGQPVLDSAIVAKSAEFFLRSGGNEVTLTGVDPASLKAGVVKEYHNLPADYAKFQRFIEDLTKPESKITRAIGSKPERLEKLGFSGDRIELRDKDSKAVWTLHLGSSPERGGRFVKFGDENKAYLSSLSIWLDATAKTWADAALVSAKAEDVLGIEARFPGAATVSATRADAKSAWTASGLAEGETLKDTEVTSLVGKLVGLRFTDTRDPESLETIAGRPTARTFVVTLADGRTLTITASQRTDPPPAPPTPPAEGETPPAPPPQPADVFVQSSRAEDPINDMMKQRSFQVAEWTFTGLPGARDALVNPAPASAPAETPAPAASEPSGDSASQPTEPAPAAPAAAP